MVCLLHPHVGHHYLRSWSPKRDLVFTRVIMASKRDENLLTCALPKRYLYRAVPQLCLGWKCGLHVLYLLKSVARVTTRIRWKQSSFRG